jgi:23S rRNA (uracil1939-C5)-methyltransferase
VPSPDDLLAVTALAVGGEGVAREPSGRVVFVEGALPDERVRVTVTDERRHHARAALLEVIEPAPSRVTPPCPFVAAGCGGCGWQHVDPEAQRALKASMVAEALARLGGVPDPEVAPGPVLPATGYRTTLRGVADAAGRFALRRHHSHDLVPVPDCLVAHPRLAEVAAEGRFPAGSEITIRVGARTGDRMVIVDGPAGAVEVPDGVRVVTGDELAGGRRAWLFEVVAGVRLRVSARSFFQAGPDAAEALVAAVGEALGPCETLADLYAGVGLFAATVGRGARVVAVEASASAAADARVNLAGGDAKVVRRRGSLAPPGGRGRSGRSTPGRPGPRGRASGGRHPSRPGRAGQLRRRGLGPGRPVAGRGGLRLDGVDAGRRLPAHAARRGGVALRAPRMGIGGHGRGHA